MKKGQYQHANVSVCAKIMAPILIVPSDIFNAESTYLRIDLGSLSVKSHLQDYQKSIDYKKVYDESKLYDKYVF